MDKVKKRGEVISADQRLSISTRYKRVTRAINSEFWNSSSEIAHSLYVGSYGRGTAIDTSDIDILVELPQFGITECIIRYKCSVNTPPPHAIRSG